MNQVYQSDQDVDNAPESQSVGRLLSRLGDDVGSLISTEMALARAELGENLSDTKKGVVSLLTSAVVLLAGVLLLMNGVALALTAMSTLQPWASFLIVGGVVSVVGLLLLGNGKAKLSAENLTLSRTEESLSRNRKLVSEKLS